MEISIWAISILLAIIAGLLYYILDVIGVMSRSIAIRNDPLRRAAYKYPRDFCDKVRALWKSGSTMQAISKTMGVTLSTVYYIVHKKDKIK